jgi:hypothetical protein
MARVMSYRHIRMIANPQDGQIITPFLLHLISPKRTDCFEYRSDNGETISLLTQMGIELFGGHYLGERESFNGAGSFQQSNNLSPSIPCRISESCYPVIVLGFQIRTCGDQQTGRGFVFDIE